MTRMRKGLIAVAAAVLAVWLFLMGFEIGSYHEKRNMQIAAGEQQTTTEEQQTLADAQPQTRLSPEDATTKPPETTKKKQAPSALDNNNEGDFITTYPANELLPAQTKQAPTTEKPTKPDPASLSKAQVLQQAASAVNDLKNTKNMTARRQQITTINIVDCSVPSAMSLLNSIIGRLAGEETTTYAFVNGKATGYDANGKAVKDEGEVSPLDVLPPAGRLFTLKEDGAVSATAKQVGADTVYTVKLKEERATLQNQAPRYNAQAIGYLDLDKLDISGVTFQEANMHYPGSSLVLTVDAQGRVTKLQATMPMDGGGKAKMGLLSGTASFEGTQTENWTITY